MGKKKSCQNMKVPHPLNAVERKLYGWVEEAIFTQPSVVLGDSLPDLRRTMRLTEEVAAKGDFVLEAAGPSDRLPFRADEDGLQFLWLYQELFTRLGVRLPFTNFQREVMARCRVAVSQFHLNGCGLLRTFEKESIQEFKWHYFKVLPAPGRRAFWLDDEGKPFPWVYWNREVKDFVIHELDPLETTVFELLVSLPAGLPKRNNLTCRWILDNNDVVVGKYLDDLLLFEMKKTKLDRMMEMMADPTRMAPQSVLPTGVPAATAAAATVVSAALAGSSVNPATPSLQVPPPPPATFKAKKSSSKRERPEGVDVEVEEAAKEDPDANLKQKRRRKEKGKEEDIVDRVLGDDAAWEHAVNPLDLAFSKKFNYRKALDAGLTSSSVRKHLQGMLSDQLLGESWRLQCQLGLEAALKAKTKTEEELLAAKDQLSVLKVERDSALEYLPLKEKADSLAQQLSQKEVEHKSALERVAQLHEDIKAELRKLREEADYWCTEWKSFGTEDQEMCQQTLEIVLDQVSHLCPAVDFSVITLKTRWDLKGKRIHVPGELLGGGAKVAETLPEVVSEQQQE
ncbi:hypothetical protein PIB30_000474 [Stylosanthes scabra]|uniref:Uncharacterized protein n=1 Tax=Stylosanthes scabra TaxID=79078 RepID=A0ABU6V404_9FABA|nr:hypothetical protein [Stylosanthes scabra]